MVHVKKMPGQSDDQVIRNFSRKVMDEGIIQEAKNARKFYLKPSLAKKLKKKMKQEEAARVRIV